MHRRQQGHCKRSRLTHIVQADKTKKPNLLGLGFLNDFGVADGARTHDNRNHNPGLYQLSYSHREDKIITRRSGQKLSFVRIMRPSFLWVC